MFFQLIYVLIKGRRENEHKNDEIVEKSGIKRYTNGLISNDCLS